MPASIQSEPNDLFVLHFSGVVKRSEFAIDQATLGRAIERGSRPRLLALLENFEGWEKGADWNDLDFMLTHGNEIAKIAIVGETRWEPHALAFAGAGFRRAPVKFFASEQLAEARRWLAE